MKKFVLVFLACGLATFGALRLNEWLNTRNEPALTFQPTRIVEGRLANTAATVPAGSIDFRQAAQRILKSVVSIDTLVVTRGGNWMRNETMLQQAGEGSGVIISEDGYIITNNHVVVDPRSDRPAAEVRVHLSDGRILKATVRGTDPRSDLAVLKVEANNLVPAELGDSKALQIGEWVIAAGNPLGYEQTVSVGVVSSLNRSVDLTEGGRNPRGMYLIDAIQTDAAINPGNSGGALVDSQGRLVGINTAIASPSGGSVGIGFAIPVNRVQRISQDIIRTGRARYGQLGVLAHQYPGLLGVGEYRAEVARIAGANPPEKGLLLMNVQPGSPASAAGITQFSVLLSIGNIQMNDPIDLQRALADKRPGEKVQVKFWSAGQNKTATVTLADLTEL